MKFGYTILCVPDVEATIAVYERAFKLTRRMVTPGKEYGELETGGTRLALARADFIQTLTGVPFEAAGPGKLAPPVELGLVTEDVETAFAHAVKAGAVAIKKPETKPWGQVVGYLKDCNGFLVEICTAVREQRSDCCTLWLESNNAV